MASWLTRHRCGGGSCFLFGNALPDADAMADSVLYAKLVEQNCRNAAANSHRGLLRTPHLMDCGGAAPPHLHLIGRTCFGVCARAPDGLRRRGTRIKWPPNPLHSTSELTKSAAYLCTRKPPLPPSRDALSAWGTARTFSLGELSQVLDFPSGSAPTPRLPHDRRAATRWCGRRLVRL
eukprot:7379734-Prymnesium_polylepis.2